MQLEVVLLLALQGSSAAFAVVQSSEGVRSAAGEVRACFEQAAQERLSSDGHVEQQLSAIKEVCREHEQELVAQLSLHAAEYEAQTGHSSTSRTQRTAADAIIERASEKARRHILKRRAAIFADSQDAAPAK